MSEEENDLRVERSRVYAKAEKILRNPQSTRQEIKDAFGLVDELGDSRMYASIRRQYGHSVRMAEEALPEQEQQRIIQQSEKIGG